MKNWRVSRNFRKYKNADGTFTYAITVDGEMVVVSKEIYEAYASGGYKMENMELGLKNDRVLQDSAGKAVRDEHGYPIRLPEREVSLDKLIDGDWDFASDEQSPEEAILNPEGFEITELYRHISTLSDSEQALIKALFFKGMTERDYAKALGISKTALHARKVKVLGKLKIFLSEQ